MHFVCHTPMQQHFRTWPSMKTDILTRTQGPPFSVRELHFLPLSQAQPARKPFLRSERLLRFLSQAGTLKHWIYLPVSVYLGCEVRMTAIGVNVFLGWSLSPKPGACPLVRSDKIAFNLCIHVQTMHGASWIKKSQIWFLPHSCFIIQCF